MGFAVILAAASWSASRPALPDRHGRPPSSVRDIASCAYTTDSQTAALLDNRWGTVVALGDNVYLKGTAAQYQDCYGPTWGRHLNRTQPVPGNHEYETPNASGYFGYFGAPPARGVWAGTPTTAGRGASTP